MTRKELERLEVDHPEWKLLTSEDIYNHYWMYFADRIARARAEVHLRRLVASITPALDSLSALITKFMNSFSIRNQKGKK